MLSYNLKSRKNLKNKTPKIEKIKNMKKIAFKKSVIVRNRDLSKGKKLVDYSSFYLNFFVN